MNPEELQKNIALYYSRLPAKAQQMFSSMEWLEKLKKLSIKYALNEKQMETLASETVLVLLGMIHMMEYEQNLTKELKIPEDTLETMLQDIRNSILRSVIMEITETYDKNSQEAPNPAELEDETVALEADLDARFQKLPEATRNVIVEVKYYDNLYKIARKYNLKINQIAPLEEVTTQMVTGELKADKFEGMLKDKLMLQPDIVQKIVNDINEQILRPIREKLILRDKPPITVVKKDPEIPEIKKSEEFILNKAGIKINTPSSAPTVPKLDALELPSGKENIKPTTPATNNPKPILDLSQKFQTGSQTKVETIDHTLPSATKSAENLKTKIPKVDPYREIPE